MTHTFRLQAALAAALLTMTTAAPVRADHGDNNNQQHQQLRLKAKLTGPAIAKIAPEGGADFRGQSSQTRLQVEVEHVNLAVGTVLTVMLQSGTAAPVQIGHITLSATGFGELELESGHGTAVPVVLKGDVLSVSNEGTVILAGAFGPA